MLYSQGAFSVSDITLLKKTVHQLPLYEFKIPHEQHYNPILISAFWVHMYVQKCLCI